MFPNEVGLVYHGGVGNPQREDVSVYYPVEILCRVMALVSARAMRFPDELGVEHLDLMPLLGPSPKTYYGLLHFTPTGSAMVAQAVIARFFRASPL